MSNPFDAADGTFYALTNPAGQYSLWPAGIAVPGGWTRAFGPAGRDACLDHVRHNWTVHTKH
jgi:MbtH protein